MTLRGPSIPPAAPPRRRPANELPQAVADRRNQQMTDILRKAADVREKRERDRSSEDDLSARREAAALLVLIRSHARPKARHYSSIASGRAQGQTAPTT